MLKAMTVALERQQTALNAMTRSLNAEVKKLQKQDTPAFQRIVVPLVSRFFTGRALHHTYFKKNKNSFGNGSRARAGWPMRLVLVQATL